MMPGRWPDETFQVSVENDACNGRMGNTVSTAKPCKDQIASSRCQYYIPESKSGDAVVNVRSRSTREIEIESELNDRFQSFVRPFLSADSQKTEKEADWTQYDPPRELLNCQVGSSMEIKSLLLTSIERLQERHKAEKIIQPKKTRHRGSTGHEETENYEAPNKNTSYMSGQEESNESNTEKRLTAVISASLEVEYNSFKPKIRKHGISGLFMKRNRESAEPPKRDSDSVSSSAETASSTIECVSCLEDIAPTGTVKLSCHSYCKDCFQRLISTAIESETQWPAKCCLNTIPSKVIIPHLSSDMKRKFKKKEAEYSTPIGERIYCTQPNCNTYISPRHTKPHINTARCPSCFHKLCLTCRGPAHSTSDCPRDSAIQATIELAEMEGWKRCYQCNVLVEHNQGCRHMTCRCKAQFCYICGAKWRTCGCTDEDLSRIQLLAQTRRRELEAKNTRETAEEEEVREALRLVEEFERAESMRLAREAEAEKQRHEEARRRWQEKRMADLSELFGRLESELGDLHDIQRVAIASRHEAEADILRRQNHDNINAFALPHADEILAMAVQSEATISAVEASIAKEYRLRLALERGMDEDYVAKLTSYWQDRHNGQEKIEEALAELKRRQKHDYKVWYAHRAVQLERVVESEDTRMSDLKRKHSEVIREAGFEIRTKEMERRKQHWAEERWIEAVAGERTEMLRSMAQEEYSRVAD